MNLKEYHRLAASGSKSKYNNRRVKVDGFSFDSQKEANRYCELKILKRSGEVIRFNRQIMYDLPGGVVYKLDFLVDWADGHTGYEDVKGYDTPISKLKRKQVESIHNIKIELT